MNVVPIIFFQNICIGVNLVKVNCTVVFPNPQIFNYPTSIFWKNRLFEALSKSSKNSFRKSCSFRNVSTTLTEFVHFRKFNENNMQRILFSPRVQLIPVVFFSKNGYFPSKLSKVISHNQNNYKLCFLRTMVI